MNKNISKVDKSLEDKLQNLRKGLLDISNKNKLINFSHNSRSKRIIRIVDEVPSQIYESIVVKEKGMKLIPLQGLSEPEDEKTIDFKNALELELKNSCINEDDFGSEEEFQRKDREIRNIVREKLGLKKIPEQKDIKSLAEFYGIDPSYDLPIEKNGKKHNDSDLQTLYSTTDLNRRLLTIYDESKTNEKDKGISTLYLIFGFLEWRESPISTIKITSPLLLLPISLECKITTRGGTYRINSAGRIIINKCLDLKLNDSFMMKLPEPSLNDEGILITQIEDYFKEVEQAVEKNPKWKVRRFVSLTNLDFNKIVIYEDLDPQRWKSFPLSLSSPIRHVFWGDDGCGSETSGFSYSDDISDCKDYDIDEEALANTDNDLLIKEADSSQHAAILDAINGNDIVISGPPGTGKSQTITNLIAQALGRGKKVLFMCEKLAALRVVKNRLDHCKIKIYKSYRKASLGDFCFELHSNTSKKMIHSSMAKRLEITNRPVIEHEHYQNVENINKKRKTLRNLSVNLTKNIGNSGKNYVEAVWEREKLLENFSDSDGIDTIFWNTDVAQYSNNEITEFIEHIHLYTEQYRQIQSVFPDLSKHPWRWVTSYGLNQIAQNKIISRLNDVIEVIEENVKMISDIGSILCTEIVPTNKIFDDISFLLNTPIPDIDKRIIKRFESVEYSARIQSEVDAYSDFLRYMSEAEWYSDKVNELKAIIENHNITNKLNSINSFDHVMPDRNLCDIENEYVSIERNLQYIKLLLKISTKFGPTLSIENKDYSIIGIQSLISTINQLKNFDEKYLEFIFSEFHNEDNFKQIWNDLLSESLIIENKLKTFPYQLNIHNLVTDNRIIDSVLELEKNSSFFKWIFTKEAKHARQILSEVCPEFKKLTKEKKLSLAKDIVKLKNEIESFARNPYILNINFSVIFKRDGTSILRDYDKVIRSIWKIILSNPNTKEITLKLLEMPLLNFSELSNALNDSNTLEAINILSNDVSINNDRNLSILESELTARSDYLKEIITLSNSMYLRNDIPVSKIYELKNLCSDANDKYSQLRDILEFIATFDNKTIYVINTILSYLKAVDRITTDKVLKVKLLDRGFYETFLDKISIYPAKYESQLCKLRELLIDIKELAGGLPDSLDTTKENIPLAAFSSEVVANIKEILSYSNLLSEYSDLNEIKNTIRADGTWEVIDKAQEKGIVPEKFEDVFRIAYLFTLLDRVSINGIKKSSEIESIRNEFKLLDSKLYNGNMQYIANKLLKVNLKQGIHVGSKKDYTELSLVMHEASKKQAHIPVREYLSRSLDTVMSLKPCFMMSPQTVSQYLPCIGNLFDLLIIDEASQMLPADAIAAMARSKQVIIVGDKQQLPPTNFFSANFSDIDDDIEDGESILDIADSRLRHKRMLTWHYRAKHESLINFSNRNFYDNKLIVFPSSDGRSSDYGIKFHYINGVYKNGLNEEEADALISSLPEIIKENRDKSIGIVAINQKQASLLREKFDKLLAENSDVASYVQRWEDNLEEFFIKNLENVQGDERDIIIISFVYGQTIEKNGVSGNFGPINKQNGYRRLNVLFSRAKEKIYVFTSMLYDQIKINTETLSSNNGPISLKNYLYYAANGGIDKNEESHESPTNDFEASVGKFLERNGFKVRYQVGSNGYFIDIVIDSQVGKHIIGIECDGAQYHSSKSARDRDKLRQVQLENLGWKIYRVWSTDWFHNRHLAEERLLYAVNAAFQDQLHL